MILLLVMTDGRRSCIERTLASAHERLRGPISRRIIHDDSADPTYRAWLLRTFPDFEVVSTGRRSGFGGAIRSAWSHLARTADQDVAKYVFHLEDDFVFRRDVDVTLMAGVLAAQPRLVQLALRRQPWNDAERAAGGIVEQHPTAYTEVKVDARTAWLEHRLFFTTNPSLYRRSLTWRGWPEGSHSEGRFGIKLLEELPDARFAFWGTRDSGEWVEHIGDVRTGIGY